jgi:polyhydroxyalkanoate synthesis repressor PhaR
MTDVRLAADPEGSVAANRLSRISSALCHKEATGGKQAGIAPHRSHATANPSAVCRAERRRTISSVIHKTVAAPTESAYFGNENRVVKSMPEPMTKTDKTDEPVTIKKYANRRLYNTGTSTYVTLEDLAAMVKTGEDFVVYDAKTSEDITRSVLTQIIFEQENKEGQNLLPITFLRQLIRFYGDSMQMLVPRYLEVSIESLTREQEKFRHQMAQAFGVGAFGSLEDQVRRNMEMFERTFAMFAPFARRESGAAGEAEAELGKMPAKPGGDIDDLKRQLDEMQRKVDRLSEKNSGS